jgi:proteasome alpha subunit
LFAPQSMGYDRAITVFSPEGRLYQVEYATEAVRHGPLAVGVKGTDGVVIVGEKRTPHSLVDISTLKKVMLIDDHIGTAIAGLHADARKLIDYARVRAQVIRLNYDEAVSIKSLVEYICDIKQGATQGINFARPFGVSFLVGGVDTEGPQLYTTDPSGSFWGWKATAIGKESDIVRDFFKDNYKPPMNVDGALKLALQGIMKTRGDKEELDASTIEIGRIDDKKKAFEILSQDEVQTILDAFKSGV